MSLMKYVDEIPIQTEELNEDIARKQDQALYYVYAELERIEGLIDPPDELNKALTKTE